jgi:hypothetical protein
MHHSVEFGHCKWTFAYHAGHIGEDNNDISARIKQMGLLPPSKPPKYTPPSFDNIRLLREEDMTDEQRANLAANMSKKS